MWHYAVHSRFLLITQLLISLYFRTFVLDDRQLQKRQAAAVGDEHQTYYFRGAAKTPSCSQYREQQQLAMIGSEVAKKTHSSLDHKHTTSSHHTSSSPKKPFNSYKKNFDEVGLPPVKVITYLFIIH